VQLDLVLLDSLGQFTNALGIADYGVAIIGNERIDSEPDLNGRFRFQYKFDGVEAGQRIDVQATAFRQRERRDSLKIRGRWVHGVGPSDAPDQPLASDTIRFTVYEAPIELTLARPADDLVPETGVLTILRSDGTSTRVFVDRPHRPGFNMTGPEPDGYYRVRYVPDGGEINRTGTTDVEFVVYDVAKQPHYVSAQIETP
jgi:hypothetical protein